MKWNQNHHGLEVVYFGEEEGDIVVRRAVLRYEELRKLVMPGALKIIEEGTRFGPMGLYHHWRKVFFDQQVIVTGIQHIYDSTYGESPTRKSCWDLSFL
jgi:hypothetical protein